MSHATRWQQVNRIVSHYYGAEADASRADALRQLPRDVLAADAKVLQLDLCSDDLERIADLLAEMASQATNCSLADRERMRRRIEVALTRMKRAFLLRRTLYAAVYLLGLTFALVGLYYSLRGDWQRGLIIGGVGAAHIAVSMTRNAVSGVRESSSDLLQLRAAYTSFFAEIDQWQHRYTSLDFPDALNVKRVVALQYRRSAKHAIELIDRYCKPAQVAIPQIETKTTESGV